MLSRHHLASTVPSNAVPVQVVQHRNDNSIVNKKVKVRIALYGQIHDRATERHLPYGITHCYLPPDTGERAPP